MAKTLFELSGAIPAMPAIADCALVIIDAQNEYVEGPLTLTGIGPAIGKISSVLAAFRQTGAPVIHIAHKGRSGGTFDRDDKRGQIVDALAPISGETIIEKPLPNSFARTNLHETLQQQGKTRLIMVGFMTHMCVSATARAALDLGYATTILSDACATRDLPDGQGGVVKADDIHRIELVALSDRFAGIFSASALLNA